jgi:3-oxoacyl-(acyl-carrier-protein) reductase
MNLELKNALVTGAGRGLGKAIALRLAREGADLIINDVSIDDALTTAKEIIAMRRKVLISTANVANRMEIESLFNEIEMKFGTLDILVNNAGITKDSMFHKMTGDQWEDVLDVNLTGVFNCTQLASAMMRKQNWGKIVNLASITGLMGNIGQVNYAATKAGVIGMTKSLARELARYNINVNAIAPGLIKTAMTEAVPAGIMDEMVRNIPLGRIGQPEDISNLVYFLVSEESQYITGQVISCNGGWYM